jgi:hypothetical protein
MRKLRHARALQADQLNEVFSVHAHVVVAPVTSLQNMCSKGPTGRLVEADPAFLRSRPPLISALCASLSRKLVHAIVSLRYCF